MTVAELMTELRKFTPEFPVVVEGYESGVDIVGTVKLIEVSRHPCPEGYQGKYLSPDDHDFDAAQATRAVLLCMGEGA